MQSTKFIFTIFFTISIFGISCIGDDVIFDTVDERLSIAPSIDSLQIGNTYQFDATFFNNVGVEENRAIDWRSSDEAILSIDANGLATGITAGMVQIFAEIEATTGDILRDETTLIVTEETVVQPTVDTPSARSGSIATTSSYTLEGDFTLEESENGLLLSFSDNYRASTSLPGLYVYLTNNPNTLNNAFEIGKVQTFNGAHTYNITIDADLNTYSHLLYFCKPFGVKVGDGAILE